MLFTIYEQIIDRFTNELITENIDIDTYNNAINILNNLYIESTDVPVIYLRINSKLYEVRNFANININNDNIKKDIEKQIKYIINNERKIINQVYELYKKNYTGNFNKDKTNDYIDSFEILDESAYHGKYNIGIFLSSINQFYTMFYNGKIIENETYIY